MRDDAEGRFWSKVDKSGDCWLWTAYIKADGYGQFNERFEFPVRAHRYAYELIVGPIPDGLVLDHLCRVRHCVRPDHLEPVTPRENYLRGEGLTAIAYREDKCLQGHPLVGRNIITRKHGRRECRICARAATTRRARARGVQPRAPKTHCVHGHAYTPENTVTRPNGTRYCKTCDKARRDAQRLVSGRTS